MSNLMDTDIIYPETDGQPMANSTTHGEWIILVKENLELLFRNNPQVFIAADLFWYPVEGNNKLAIAPDVMVVLGRPKGHRGSYLQWQEQNIPPQVVFEFISPWNTKKEMQEKLQFFDQYGVVECYVYDYEKNRLAVYVRHDQHLLSISVLELGRWTSPLLGIHMELCPDKLHFAFPDGSPFLTTQEREEQRRIAEKRAEEAIQELQYFREQVITKMREQGMSEELIASILDLSQNQ